LDDEDDEDDDKILINPTTSSTHVYMPLLCYIIYIYI